MFHGIVNFVTAYITNVRFIIADPNARHVVDSLGAGSRHYAARSNLTALGLNRVVSLGAANLLRRRLLS